jgi:hypothetical protein
MLYNCAMWLCVQEKKSVPTSRWFQTWLKNTSKLHTIKTKPISSYRVDIHTKQDLRDLFKKEYKLELEFTGVRSGKYIYNIDKKGCCLACPTG